jgi:hypothetical protein
MQQTQPACTIGNSRTRIYLYLGVILAELAVSAPINGYRHGEVLEDICLDSRIKGHQELLHEVHWQTSTRTNRLTLVSESSTFF